MFKLISTDNPASAGSSFVGRIAPLNYNGTQFFFDDLYSSTVSSIEHYEGKITIITRNTVYKFEKVDNG